MTLASGTKIDAEKVAFRTLLGFFALICVWILAWMLKVHLDTRFEQMTSSGGGFVYWTVAKLLIWIMPALWFIRLSGRKLSDVFNISNWKSWLLWGGAIGGLIALTGFAPKYLAGQSLLPSEFSFSLLNVLVVAPVFEEFLIRGALFVNLMQKYSVATANILSAAMFVILHMPGWYFMGGLEDMMTRPIGGAFNIFILGLAFGYATYRARSVVGGMLAHFLNNLSAT